MSLSFLVNFFFCFSCHVGRPQIGGQENGFYLKDISYDGIQTGFEGRLAYHVQNIFRSELGLGNRGVALVLQQCQERVEFSYFWVECSFFWQDDLLRSSPLIQERMVYPITHTQSLSAIREKTYQNLARLIADRGVGWLMLQHQERYQ